MQSESELMVRTIRFDARQDKEILYESELAIYLIKQKYRMLTSIQNSICGQN